jgi:phytoene dehydrogenase-like protein
LSKKVIVIGAGIAGLTAAVYAQRSGFDVTLIEQHSIVGGMCTSWKRKGYLFEGAMHWLTGSGPKTQVYQIWKDTGALSENMPILHSDPFFSVDCDGQIINLYRDIDKTARLLNEISPVDKPLLRKLVKDVKTTAKMQMPVFDIKGVKTKNPKRMTLGFLHNMLHALPVMRRLGKLNCKEFAMRFKHPGIQRLFSFVPDDYTASSLIFTLATLHSGDGGYPDGGSLAMVHRMSKMFTDIGGKLLLNTQVQKVNTSRGMVTGVSLLSGTLDADAVIVTQETIAALDCLFDTPPQDAWINELRKNLNPAVCTFIVPIIV